MSINISLLSFQLFYSLNILILLTYNMNISSFCGQCFIRTVRDVISSSSFFFVARFKEIKSLFKVIR